MEWIIQEVAVADAAIALVAAVFRIVADRPPDLPRFVIDAECRPRGNADDAVKANSVFHHDIHHACAEHSAHGAALQDQARFHPCPASCDFVDFDILPMLSEYWFDESDKLQRWENILHGVFQ